MSDIGIFPPGSDLLFPAMLLVLVGGLTTLVATIRAAWRSRRLGRPMRLDPALAAVSAGAVMTFFSLALAVAAANMSLEHRETLDAWWVQWVGAVLLATLLTGWGSRRMLAP